MRLIADRSVEENAANTDRMKTQVAVLNSLRRAVSTALLVALGTAAAVAWTPTAAAQSKGDVQISLVARKVTTGADGKEKLLAADTARPGELIQYDAVYQNKGQRDVHKLAPTLPIPAGMEFVAESAVPAATHASLDGRTFAPFPLMRKVKRPDGRLEEQPVPLAEYRALRWSGGDLAAGATTRVVARVRLQTNVAAK